MKVSRILLPVTIGAALVLSAGCSVNFGGGSGGSDCVQSGKVSDSIGVKGDLGQSPQLTTDTPLKPEKLERTVIKDGKGETLKNGKGLVLQTAFFNGKTGDLLSAGSPQGIVYSSEVKKAAFPWESAVTTCAQQGQRVAVVGTVKQMFDKSAEELGITGVSDKDAVVAVADVVSVLDLQEPKGKMASLGEGMPEVTEQKSGGPAIKIPEGAAAPSELIVKDLIAGKGEKVKDGDTVFVNYRGVIWASGKEFDSSYSRNQPAAFNTAGVIPGFSKALVGKKVGSRVISIVPPASGYGEGLTQMGYNADDVMVFVLDILGTSHTS